MQNFLYTFHSPASAASAAGCATTDSWLSVGALAAAGKGAVLLAEAAHRQLLAATDQPTLLQTTSTPNLVKVGPRKANRTSPREAPIDAAQYLHLTCKCCKCCRLRNNRRLAQSGRA
jgi:hypothetical protein